jgi:hypothetical protein
MAITAVFTTQHGVVLPSAYFNIGALQSFKQRVSIGGAPDVNQFTLRAYCSVYASQAAYASGLPALEEIEKVYPYNPEESAYFQAYAALALELGSTARST